MDKESLKFDLFSSSNLIPLDLCLVCFMQMILLKILFAQDSALEDVESKFPFQPSIIIEYNEMEYS